MTGTTTPPFISIRKVPEAYDKTLGLLRGYVGNASFVTAFKEGFQAIANDFGSKGGGAWWKELTDAERDGYLDAILAADDRLEDAAKQAASQIAGSALRLKAQGYTWARIAIQYLSKDPVVTGDIEKIVGITLP